MITYLRYGADSDDFVVAACNFTPVVRNDYRIGVPKGGLYRELFNSDAAAYGGSNVGNTGAVMAEAELAHGRPFSLSLTLPPLATVILRPA